MIAYAKRHHRELDGILFYKVDRAARNLKDFMLLEEEEVDLLIMDRNLPGVEGSEFVAELRSSGIQTPVIYLTAKNKESDIEEGFLRGGDDYITKPFNTKEMILQIPGVLTQKIGNDSFEQDGI